MMQMNERGEKWQSPKPSLEEFNSKIKLAEKNMELEDERVRKKPNYNHDSLKIIM